MDITANESVLPATQEIGLAQPSKEIKSTFTSENLSRLPMDQYLEVWRKAHPYYVSHVTKQGIRDHNITQIQVKGTGQVLEDFTATLRDGKTLKSLVQREGLIPPTEESVRAFFKKRGITDKDPKETMRLFNLIMEGDVESKAPQYADMFTAMHFSAEEVDTLHWGAEQGNEIFMIFPADFIASQFPFSFLSNLGQGYYAQPGFRGTPGESVYNDLYIWSNTGILLDAGVVFLPKDVLVDPQTGSTYDISQFVSGKIPPKITDGIKAQDYWENFFTKHPDLKPSKKVYYDGNPNQAARDFLTKNGIIPPKPSERSDNDMFLGFPENYVPINKIGEDPRCNLFKNEIKTIGKSILKA